MDELLSAYEEIGNELPILGRNNEYFRNHTGFQRLVSRIFAEVMAFHADAIRIYSGRGMVDQDYSHRYGLY